MTSKRIVNKALAYLVRYTPGFLGRHRHRYRFYLRVKNSDLVLRRKPWHSRIPVPLRLGDWIQYWFLMDGISELGLVDFLSCRVKEKVFLDVYAPDFHANLIVQHRS